MYKSLPQHKNYILYFYIWFNFPELQLKLKDFGLSFSWYSLSKQASRMHSTSQSDVRKQGRGNYDSKAKINSGLGIIRWFDIRAVQTSSAHVGVQPLKTMKHWDGKAKKTTNVNCSAIIAKYNANMGGVDLFDMLSAMYHTDHKSLKFYGLQMLPASTAGSCTDATVPSLLFQRRN
jgi:hypothetical protein